MASEREELESPFMKKARSERREELDDGKRLHTEGCIDTPEWKAMRQDAMLRFKKVTEARTEARMVDMMVSASGGGIHSRSAPSETPQSFKSKRTLDDVDADAFTPKPSRRDTKHRNVSKKAEPPTSLAGVLSALKDVVDKSWSRWIPVVHVHESDQAMAMT